VSIHISVGYRHYTELATGGEKFTVLSVGCQVKHCNISRYEQILFTYNYNSIGILTRCSIQQYFASEV